METISNVEVPNAPALTPVVVHAPWHIKVKEPKLFSGKPGQLRPFMTQLRLYFGFNLNPFREDCDKILFVTSYMREGAYEWVAGRLEDYLKYLRQRNRRDNGTNEIFNSFGQFEDKLTEVFGDIDRDRTAERQIGNLKQTRSASDYGAEFMRLVAILQWDDDALYAQYYQGLKNIVKDEIMKSNRPEGIGPLSTLAICIDARLYKRSMKKREQTTWNPKFKQQTKKVKKPWYGPQLMEIDNMQKGKNNISKKERKRRFKKRLCLNCGKAGHMTKACRSKQQVNNAEQTTKKLKKDKGKALDQSINILELEETNPYNDEIYYKEDISEELDPRDYWNDLNLSKEQQIALDSIEEEVQELTIQADKKQFTEPGSQWRPLQARPLIENKPEQEDKEDESSWYLKMAHARHATIHWSICYDSTCMVHKDKQYQPKLSP